MQKILLLTALIASVFISGGCTNDNAKNEETLPTKPPEWTKEAIWYQIFVERFHNGDVTNDPTSESIQGSYPGYIPDDWKLTPWTQDWYQADEYFSSLDGKTDFTGNEISSFDAKTALRRYGGDLQGVIDKLDYLQTLGINAIYFNPINDAPSMHKYDARHWRHVDVNFGPEPAKDREIIADEDPSDPDTWEFTHADKLFLALIKQAKARGIRVILDYSWNHTGHTFWAWQDLLKNQQSSDYADWYWVKQFDDPDTPDNEFEYRGWFGVFDLPEIKETVYADHAEKVSLVEGNIYSQAAKEHIFAITRRWLDPNGDGDPEDGIDGFRLDVAAEVPIGFWREYREVVKRLNPEAYLVGEIWWEKFPDDLFDPQPFLQGDIFDAVMNYRWYREARRFFAEAPNPISANEFSNRLASFTNNLAPEYPYAMMNMSASHDSPRLSTSFYNNNKYKFNAKETQDANYKINKPDLDTTLRVKLMLAHQYTYVGAPQIWQGDEMGMWGSDDPHNRKPLIWPELTFDDEKVHPLGKPKKADKVAFDQSMFDYYQSLIKLRQSSAVLRLGEIQFDSYDDGERLLSYRRFWPDSNDMATQKSSQAWVAFNLQERPVDIEIPEQILNTNSWTLWQSSDIKIKQAVPAETLTLNGLSALIIISE
ncbi:glycoside hydrolase family 13 protein [Glaciecola petra]|uniref:Glycoside hydrolase family 13 protein n=1 Tax=Glaciecola petra TaxID=3075602 RepID=A0ABU2ZSD1_9ALTE|nr:glycoside hydrolase family 13 protein [Aestuariibacter sp. P117]MDT0594938.1 glycoside hydrolase family 13 protein [Aestuariibacter sp. P117]